MIAPTYDNVLARKLKDIPNTNSPIITVDFKEEERGMVVGEVLAVGPGCYKEGVFVDLPFTPGDVIICPLHWSNQIYYEGKDLLLLPGDKIRGKVIKD